MGAVQVGGEGMTMKLISADDLLRKLCMIWKIQMLTVGTAARRWTEGLSHDR